jgi:acetyl esterase/lipase
MTRTLLLLAIVAVAAGLTYGARTAGGLAPGGGDVRVSTSTHSYLAGPDADPVRHRLDLYRPEAGRDLPVLLFAHGGVWRLGSKDEYRNIGETFARRGILTAVVNYRLTPAVRHPAHAQDVAAAVAWLAAHAPEHGGRADRIFLSGHSAGGHLISLLLFDKRYLATVGIDADRLAGVIPLSGIFDLTQPIDDVADGGFPRYIDPPFGDRRRDLEAASPVTHLRPTPVPILVALAGADYRAMQRQSEAFVSVLRTRSMDVVFETVAGREHFELVHAIGRDGDPTTELIAKFVRSRPRAGGR